MPGAGTKTATTSDSPAARCLDLTRLISRQGRGPLTGVDRVELAYLRHLLDDPVPVFALVRTALGFLLLDEKGARQVLDRLDGKVGWGAADLIGRLTQKASPEKRRAESDLRRFSRARCRKGRLKAMLQEMLPPGTRYLNVGHSNLTQETLGAWRAVPGARTTVFVHDTIPLDYPRFQRPGTVETFQKKMQQVAAFADLVIYNSQATRSDAERWFTGWGRCPKGVVAHLGLEMPQPDSARLPEDLDFSRPYFVTLGTIEPRKNHALLLDIWEALAGEMHGADIPRLIIAGSRGWVNEAVFRRLDTSAVMNRTVFERPGLNDAQVAALLKSSAGLLFPSLAEGYGLPVLEAAALGVPVVCSDLAVYREFLENIPVYLDSSDVYLWKQSIIRFADEKRAGHERDEGKTPPPSFPTWADHFNLVLKVT